jgi:uncharacterized protein (UPF0333 family)
MKNQRGAVSGALVAVLAIVALLIALAGVAAVSYISAYNFGNSTEQQLKAVRENNKNILAQYGQKVQEAAQVPSMYAEDVTKVVTAAVQGRYGADGSKATWQMLKEQNPSLDASMYKQIQQIIESGRNDFQNGQSRQIAVKQGYETALGSFWQGMWLRIAGYPKLNLDEFKIISTGRADDAYQKGKEDAPLKLR